MHSSIIKSYTAVMITPCQAVVLNICRCTLYFKKSFYRQVQWSQTLFSLSLIHSWYYQHTQHSHSTHVENEMCPDQEHSCNSNLPLSLEWTEALLSKHRHKGNGKDVERQIHPSGNVKEIQIKLLVEVHNFKDESKDGVEDNQHSCSLEKHLLRRAEPQTYS